MADVPKLLGGLFLRASRAPQSRPPLTKNARWLIENSVGEAVSANGATRLSNRNGQPNPSLAKFDLTLSTRDLAVLGIWEKKAMKTSFPLVPGPAVAFLPIALLLCGLSGTAMSATPSAGATTSLPNVVVEAPKQVARPQKLKQRAVARSTVSPRTSPTATPSASPMSPAAQLAKLEKTTGSCVDGCVTSFRSGNRPWVGCSVSGWPASSSTCRNVGNYKTTPSARRLDW
jgi:hypothetical protein